MTYTRDRIVEKQTGTLHEKSAIDHFYSNSPDTIIHLENSISDHKILLGYDRCHKTNAREKLIVRDWRNYSRDDVINLINEQKPEPEPEF